MVGRAPSAYLFTESKSYGFSTLTVKVLQSSLQDGVQATNYTTTNINHIKPKSRSKLLPLLCKYTVQRTFPKTIRGNQTHLLACFFLGNPPAETLQNNQALRGRINLYMMLSLDMKPGFDSRSVKTGILVQRSYQRTITTTKSDSISQCFVCQSQPSEHVTSSRLLQYLQSKTVTHHMRRSPLSMGHE